jgi:hypothetical protein
MREGIQLDNSINPFGEDGLPASKQPIPANFDYSLSAIIKPWVQFKWISADKKVYYYRDEEGWYAKPYDPNIIKAMQDVGLLYVNPPSQFSLASVRFSTLKETRQAVEDSAKEAGLSLNNRLTRTNCTEYQIGSFPLRVVQMTHATSSSWSIRCVGSLPASFESFFPGGKEEFTRKFREANLVGIDGKRWATRTQALQAVKALIQGHQ